MKELHIWLGVSVLASNGLAGGLGAILWLRHRFSNSFWIVLRVAQAAVTVQVAIGLFLLARGSNGSPDGLHIAYGVSPLVITLVSEAMRVGAAQRQVEEVENIETLEREEQVALARRVARAEIGVMTVGVLMILTLALRAYQTGGV